MRNIVLQPTSTAQWHALVQEAESRARHTLNEDVENYLVILLERFLSKPEIATRILALDYLKGLYAAGRRQVSRLRDVGDICLLHAGLFPRRARKRRVSSRYYIDLGTSAYYQLHQNNHHHLGKLFAHLCHDFIPAMDVLLAMQTTDHQPVLDAINAYELWEQTGSAQAEQYLHTVTRGTLIQGPSGNKH